jgi:cathepsin L
MSNAKLLVIAGFLVIGTLAALMFFTSTQHARSNLSEIQVRRDMFAQWKLVHDKTYSTEEEEEKRFKTWSDNYDFVQEHNAIPGHLYTVGMNVFADLSHEEFISERKLCTVGKNSGGLAQTLENTSLPASVDWRQKGAVTPIKNQQQCGSCYSFSSTGSLEGLNAIKNGKLVSFSEQQIVDCSSSYGNMGCNGGLMDNCFKYTAAKGIEPASAYPYKAVQGKCQYSKAKTVFKNTGFSDVPQGDNDALAAAVAQQPVSVGIEADSSAFQLYTSGIFNDDSCGTQLDHGVLNVGYGASGQTDYWIIKNSWGTTWGESGYMRMIKQSGTGPGMCGVANTASYPTGSAQVQAKHGQEGSEQQESTEEGSEFESEEESIEEESPEVAEEASEEEFSEEEFSDEENTETESFEEEGSEEEGSDEEGSDEEGSEEEGSDEESPYEEGSEETSSYEESLEYEQS